MPPRQSKSLKIGICINAHLPRPSPSQSEPQAPPGDDKPDPTKRVKTGQPSPKVSDIKCYDIANPTNHIRLMALPNLTTGPQPCALFYRDGSQCIHGDDCKFAHVPMVNLPEQSRKEWFDHINKTSNLHFNMKTCTLFTPLRTAAPYAGLYDSNSYHLILNR